MTNREFFDRVPIRMLRDRIEAAGFDDAPDVHLIFDYLGPFVFKRSSILEFGAGDGRVVDAILKLNRSYTIHAVERSTMFVPYLVDKYRDSPAVKIIEADLSSSDVALPQVDVVLWLFGGICDFGREEQATSLKRLAACAKQVLVFDVPAEAATTAATRVDGQVHIHELPTGLIHRGYVPARDECLSYIEAARLRLVNHMPYTTCKGLCRCLYFCEVKPG